MIFAAGLGTRLRPLTDHVPKALVAVAGRPLLEHLLIKLHAAGFGHVVINVHHFADQIVRFVETHNGFGLRVTISDERDLLLDTGGGLRRAAPFFDASAPVLVHNVDIVSDLDLGGLYDTFAQNPVPAADALLAVNDRATSRYLLFDNAGRLRGWQNIATGEVKSPVDKFRAEAHHAKAFMGIHVIHPTLFPLMATWPATFSIIDFYLSICARRTVVAHEAPEGTGWVDAGKAEALARAAALCEKRRW